MNDQTYQPLCLKCLEDGTETLATTTRWDEDLCASCDDRANERAYEASLREFYGGGGCQTARERFDVDSMKGRS